MRRTFWFGALLGILLLASAAAAKADVTLEYTLTPMGSSTPLATWQMSLMPTPSCPSTPPMACFISGEYFLENVNLSLNGGPAVPDTLVFFNTTFTTNVDLNDANLSIPEFFGQQLYSLDESAPMMDMGSFPLTDDSTQMNYILNVSVMPEPSAFLLLATGLICAAVSLRRHRLVN